jgi:hypothetical protein
VSRKVGEIGGVDLMTFMNRAVNETYFWAEAFDGKLQDLAYFMVCRSVVVKTANNAMRNMLPKKAAFQAKVWRSGGLIEPRRFVRNTFWKLIFSKNRLAISDKVQSDEGERFWKDRIAEAIRDPNLSTYLFHCDVQGRTLNIEGAEEISSVADLTRAYTSGNDLRGHHRRIGIFA